MTVYNGGKSYTIKRHGMGEFWRQRLVVPGLRRFVDGMCGSGAVSAFVGRERPDLTLVCNDLHPAAVALLREAAAGWIPPRALTEAEYGELRTAADRGEASALIGFAGFACSHGGKYFAGYVRPHPSQRDRAGAGANAVTRDAAHLTRASFHCLDYHVLPATIGVLPGDLWYFDKPYEGTTGYKGTPNFDHAAFWTWAAELSLIVPVLVSEFAAPGGWRSVWSANRKQELRSGSNNEEVRTRTEHVFEFAG